jgi:acyl carrier protein
MSIDEKVISLVVDTLQLDKKRYSLKKESALIGAIPEFDSMAVISVVTALEAEFDFVVDDDELDASIFETVGSVINFVKSKLNKVDPSV